MRRGLRLALLLLVLAGLPAGADRSPDSGQLTVLAAPWGEVYCSRQCSFSQSPDGLRTTVSGPRGQVVVARAGRWLNLQFPGHTARVRHGENEVLVQFGGHNYRFVKNGKRELKLQFPTETVYYTLSGGGLRTILGPNGALTVSKDTQKKRFTVTSEAGTSIYQVRATRTGKNAKDRVLRLETLEGEAPERHPYFHRGVRFEDGEVGIFISLEGGPLLQALDWKATRLIAWSAPETKAPPAPAGPQVNPLKAQTPANATLKAQVVAPHEDPLRTRSVNQDPKYPKGPNPLKVNEVPRGVDKLKVQEIDPTK